MFLLKFLFKTFLSILLLLIILGLGIIGLGIWLSPYFAPKILDDYVSRKTGFEMVTKNFDMSLFKGTVRLADITIYNPTEYNERIFLKSKEFFIDTQLLSLLPWNTLHLDEVILDIDNLTWVRNERDNVNLVEFIKKAHIEQDGSSSSSQSGVATPKTSSQRKIFIKRLIVRLGTITVVGFPDRTSPPQTFSVNYNREFNDVQDLSAISRKIGADMAHLGVKVLVNGILQSEAMQNLIRNLGEKVAGKVLDAFDVASQKTEAKLNKVGEKLNKNLQNLFNKLF